MLDRRSYPSEEIEPWRDWYGKPAIQRRRRTRLPSLKMALAQAAKAGVAVSGATIGTDGSVSLKFGGDAVVEESKSEKVNRWDEVLKRDPAKITLVKS